MPLSGIAVGAFGIYAVVAVSNIVVKQIANA